MLSDGLMFLSDCFTANDISTVIDYLCCDGTSGMREFVLLSFYYSFLLLYFIYDCIINK